MDIIDQVIKNRPRFHVSETEIFRDFKREECQLSDEEFSRLSENKLTCYGIEEDVLRFLADSVAESSHTLETGAGCSTLIFAIKKCVHTAVTPSEEEIARIKQYALKNSIDINHVDFIAKPSEQFLPNSSLTELDLVLLDGKHAFPWPIIDWFFTVDRLKENGLLLLDDAEMKSVKLLVDFMIADPNWEKVHDFAHKTVAFRKLNRSVLDVAWHMQPWLVNSSCDLVASQTQSRRSTMKRLITRLFKKAFGNAKP